MVSKTVVVNQNIPWQDVPGYSVLIKHFLSELKRREVRTLSKYFIDASVAILLNEKLLNIFIVIIYNKTRVFDWMNVFANLDLINTWMKTYQIRQKQLPTTFDYNFFLKGLEIIMESDHATNIAKVFWVIYNNYNTLTGKFGVIYLDQINLWLFVKEKQDIVFVVICLESDSSDSSCIGATRCGKFSIICCFSESITNIDRLTPAFKPSSNYHQ